MPWITKLVVGLCIRFKVRRLKTRQPIKLYWGRLMSYGGTVIRAMTCDCARRSGDTIHTWVCSHANFRTISIMKLWIIHHNNSFIHNLNHMMHIPFKCKHKMWGYHPHMGVFTRQFYDDFNHEMMDTPLQQFIQFTIWITLCIFSSNMNTKFTPLLPIQKRWWTSHQSKKLCLCMGWWGYQPYMGVFTFSNSWWFKS